MWVNPISSAACSTVLERYVDALPAGTYKLAPLNVDVPAAEAKLELKLGIAIIAEMHAINSSVITFLFVIFFTSPRAISFMMT